MIINKPLLTILTMLTCTCVQSSTQYPGLTNNYDSVLKANINDLRYEFNKSDDYEIEWFKRATAVDKKPISLSDINKPVLTGFVKASDYLDESVISKFALKTDLDGIIYVLKDRIGKIKNIGSLSCEYKVKLNDYHVNRYYHNLKGLKDPYIKFMISKGYEADVFIDKYNLLGITKLQKGYDSGSIRVLIKGRILTLSIFDCPQTEGKEQIIKDLTEWSELLIEANK